MNTFIIFITSYVLKPKRFMHYIIFSFHKLVSIRQTFLSTAQRSTAQHSAAQQMSGFNQGTAQRSIKQQSSNSALNQIYLLRL